MKARVSSETAEEEVRLSGPESGILLLAVLVVAMCGIVYELIMATVSSYLLGDSVYQFSVTIGLFMFAMGVGSFFTQRLHRGLLPVFIAVEITVAIAGGLSGTLLFVAFPYPTLYRAVMYGLILVVGALVGMEIPILTRMLCGPDGVRRALANVLSLDYLGALVGSVGFPILLLPTLGLFCSSYAVGLVNIAVAAATVYACREKLPRWPAWAAGCGAVAALLLAGLSLSEGIAKFAEGRLFADRVILRKQTPYQRIVLTRSDRNGELRLYLDGHLQFASLDEYRYHEALVHPVLSLPGEIGRVLILGGGDGMAAREALKHPGVKHIDLVDIDPAMTDLCRDTEPLARINAHALSDPRVTVHNEDALAFLLGKGPSYDRAILDLPDPHNEAINKLYSVEMYRALCRRMTNDGAFVTQATSPYYTREACWCIADTMREATSEGDFSRAVYSYGVTVPSFGMWAFHLAAPEPALAAGFPIDEQKTRYLTRASLAAGGLEGKDIAHVATAVNSMFRPTLYPLYQLGLQR